MSWWPAHEFIVAALAQAEAAPPVAGTPAWCALADSDPAKLLALAVAGEHWVLRMETAQEQRAEASKMIAASADWPAVAQEIRQRREARAAGISGLYGVIAAMLGLSAYVLRGGD